MKRLGFLLAVLMLANIAQADVKQDIIDRCKRDMNEYGAAIVKSCVDQDIEAYNAITKYYEQHKGIFDRCIRDMKDYGWAIVKSCADQDIAAEKALSEY